MWRHSMENLIPKRLYLDLTEQNYTQRQRHRRLTSCTFLKKKKKKEPWDKNHFILVDSAMHTNIIASKCLSKKENLHIWGLYFKN